MSVQDISVEQAVDMLLGRTREIEDVERVPLDHALGRVLAEDMRAPFPNPPFDRSPLDGYTFAAEATKGATERNPVRLAVVGEECAGAFYEKRVVLGTAVRIMTGGAIPAGCDCVVRQEDVLFEAGGITVPYELHHHENYCFAGEDVAEGALLARQGEELSAAHIGVLASLGFAELPVYRRLRVAIASTGDELMLPGTPLAPGKIYNSNLYLLSSRLREMGFDPMVLGILPDDAERAAALIARYREKADLFLTTGGVSVGKKDIMHGVVKTIGERLFWRVCMKPGAPAIGYTSGTMLGIALSGNPFASYATFELLVRPVLAKFARRASVLVHHARGVLADAFPKKSLGRRFIRAHFDAGTGRVTLPEQHASGTLSGLARCNAFVEIPAGTSALKAGAEVDVVLLK